MHRIAIASLPLLGMMLADGAMAAGGQLLVYNWTDYTSPQLIEKFEKETGIKVTLDTYDTNETLVAKLKSGGTGYDIIMPSAQYVPELVAQGLLEKVDPKSMPGYAAIKADWRNPWWDPTGEYVVPWQTGTTSFAVDTAAYKGPVDSWTLLFAPPPELQGKIGMLTSLPDLMGAVQLAAGVPLCSEDAKEMMKVQSMLMDQKPYVKIYSSDGVRERLITGETPMSLAWSGGTMRARAEKASIQYAYPKEGVVGWTDTVAVPKGASSIENAKLFMAFILKPENAALVSNFAQYSMPIEGVEAHLDEALKTAPEINPPAGTKIEFLKQCSPQANKMQAQILTKLLQ